MKEIDIKNRACYYFDDIIRDFGINFDDILLDKKIYENISVYEISYKTSTSLKPLRIRFDIINGFIRVCGGEFRYLLFDHGLFDKICDKIKHLTSEKSSTTDSINHDFGKISIDSYNSLPIEKILSFRNLIYSLNQLLVRIKLNTTIIYF